MCKRSLQFVSSATGIARPSTDAQDRIRGNGHSRLIKKLAVHQDLSGHNPALCFVNTFKKAKFNQQSRERKLSPLYVMNNVVNFCKGRVSRLVVIREEYRQLQFLDN